MNKEITITQNKNWYNIRVDWCWTTTNYSSQFFSLLPKELIFEWANMELWNSDKVIKKTTYWDKDSYWYKRKERLKLNKLKWKN